MIFLILIVVSHSAELTDLALSIENAEVNVLTSYQISFKPSSGVSTDSLVQFDFPSDVTVPSSAALSCVISNVNSPPDSAYCESSGNTVTVFQMFENGGTPDTFFFTLSVTFNSIQNPSSVRSTSPIGIRTLTASLQTIDESLSSDALVILPTTAVLQSASITPSEDILGKQSVWTFTFTPKYSIPTGSFIEVSMPYWNAYIGASGGKLRHFVRQDTPMCTAVSNLAAISCSYDSTDQRRALTVSGGFTQSTSGEVSFTVEDVYNPPSPSSVTGFVFTILDSNSYKIEEKTELSVLVTSPNQITGVSILLENTEVSAKTNYFISFAVTNPLHDGCLIRLQFPSETTFDTDLAVQGVTNINTVLTYQEESSHTILVNDGYSEYLLPTSSIFVQVQAVLNPDTSKTTESFLVTTLTADMKIIDTGSGNPISATPGAILPYLDGPIVLPDSFVVAEVTSYVFSFEVSHAIPAGGVLQVTIPSVLSVTEGSGLCDSPIGIDGGANCDITGSILTITDCFPLGFNPGHISFKINQVQNAMSAIESSSFIITTFNDSALDGKIDEKSSGLTITALPAPLVSASISTDSEIAGAISTFVFEVETTNAVPLNGYFMITLPSGMYVDGIGSCEVLIGFNTDSILCEFTQDTIKAYGFQLGEYASGTLRLSVGSIANPPSTKPIGSFVLTTLNESDEKIDETSQGLYIQISLPNTLRSVSVSLGSPKNTVETTYTFQIEPVNPLEVSYKIKIVPPVEVEFRPLPQCPPHLCLLESGELTITLAEAYSSVFQVSVNPVKNPSLTRETGTFKIYTFTDDDYEIDKLEEGITVQTTEGTPISNIIITPGDSLIGKKTEYEISFVSESAYPAGTILRITIPSELQITLVTITSVALSEDFEYQQVSSEIEITEGFPVEVAESSLIDLKISPVTNPSSNTSPTSTWRVAAITPEGYIMDESNSLQTTLSCDDPCFTCDTLTTFCISCTPPLPYLFDNTCIAECPDLYTDPVSTAETVCEKCSSPCYHCDGEVDQCTNCQPPTPYLYDQSCHSSCKDTHYPVGNVCFECPNPCYSCSNSSSCKSCTILNGTSTQTYLLDASCVVSCNRTGYYEDSTTLRCEACSSQCVNCTGSPDYCTECPNGEKALDGGCVTSCPVDGRYIEINNTCESCESPCDQCETLLNNCKSCVSGYFLNGSECLSACPNGTFQGASKCFDCVFPCEQCSLGTTICDTCELGYLLEETSCVSSCSEGYVSNGDQCEECQSPCETCSGTPSSCDTCLNSLVALDNVCVSECPTGTHIQINSVCESCDANCRTCTASPTNCMSCDISKSLYNNQCVDSCPAGVTIEINGECKNCNSNCAECSQDVNNCTACNDSFLLQDGECVDQCTVGYLADGSVCNPCQDSCFHCEGTISNCVSCANGSYLYVDDCVSECPSGYSPNGGVCFEENVECSPGCTSELFSNDDCDTICNVETCFYDNYKCSNTLTCPSLQYEINGTCQQCSYPCNECLSPNTCLSCAISPTTQKVLLMHEDYCYDSCPAGTFKDGFICKECFSNCASCTGEGNNECTSCDSPYFLYNFQCISACPLEVSVESGVVCLDCDQSCGTCEGLPSTCTSCNSDRLLQGSSCKFVCDSGYLAVDSVCKQCENCAECVNSVSECSECNSPDFIYNSKCLSECPQGTYPSQNECKDCPISCVICSEPDSCSVCASAYYKFNDLCLSECPAGYSPTSGVCIEDSAPTCASECSIILLFNGECDDECDTIDCNYDNQACAEPGRCASGEFFSVDRCEPCIYPCSVCDSASYCTACQSQVDTGSPLYVYNGICVLECPSGTMLIAPACVDCQDPCKECASSVDTCTDCETGKYLHEGTCVDACPSDITVSVGSVCEKCHSNCLTCSGTIDTCLSCGSGQLLDGTRCVADCPPGYSISSSDLLTCQPCNNNCETCRDEPSFCESCVDDYFLFQNACYTSCPAEVSLNISGECQACTSPCEKCTVSLSTCTECEDGFFLFNYSCLSECPSGFEARNGNCEALCADGCSAEMLENNLCDLVCNREECMFDNGDCRRYPCTKSQFLDNETCTNCPGDCSSCDTAGCLSCDGLKLLYNSSCFDTCPSGTYMSGYICKPCDSSCKECSGEAAFCTQCENSSLYKNSCISTCPENVTVEVDGECLDCEYPCAECSGSTDYCSKCFDSAFVSNGTCIEDCPESSFKSGGSCESCDSSCLSCSGSADTCVQCSEILHNNQCLSECPVGLTTTKVETQSCAECSSSCRACADSPFLCTECEDPLLLTTSATCQEVTVCPTDFLKAGTVCLPCEDVCATCEVSVSNCTSCIDGYAFINNECIQCSSECETCQGTIDTCTACHDGAYLENAECLPCQDPCSTCTASSCITCIDGFTFNGATCEACQSQGCIKCDPADSCSECLSSYFLNGDICQVCSSNCLTCEQQYDLCTSCASGMYLDAVKACRDCSDNCVECQNSADNCTLCEENEILINGQCGICNENCKTCVDSFNTCASCKDGLELLNGKCGICSQDCVTCVSDFDTCGSCLSEQVLISGSCVNCDSPCLTCSVSPISCTSCQEGFLLGSSCITECPSGYFQSGASCVLCSSPCSTCTDSECLTCIEGYHLVSDTCEQLCGEDQYFSEGICYSCSSNCKTCTSSSENCTSCPSGQELDTDSICKTICLAGYTRIDGECQECNSFCSGCSGQIDYCTGCADSTMSLYNGSCLESCPKGITVLVGGECIECEGNCVTCEDTSTTCTSCSAGLYLYNSTCSDTCPIELTNGICCLSNCEEVPTDDSFDSGAVPFPFSVIASSSAGLIVLTKMTASSISFLPAALSIWSLTASVSWVSLALLVPFNQDEESRRLMEMDIGGSSSASIAFILIVGGLGLNYICNLVFLRSFMKKIYRQDADFVSWRNRHSYVTNVVIFLSGALSFHFVRFLVSGLCNKKNFRAEMKKINTFYRYLTVFGYTSILCTCFPLLGAQILLLESLEISNWLWMLSLDSLIITLLFLTLLIFDLIRMEKKIPSRKSTHPLKQLADDYPHFAFYGLGNSLDKEKSKSVPCSPSDSPVESPRRNSFPLEEDISPIMLEKTLQDLRDSWAEDATLLADDQLMFNKRREHKHVTISTNSPSFKLISALPEGEVEVIAMTEQCESLTIKEEEIDLTSAVVDLEDINCIHAFHTPTGDRVKLRKSFSIDESDNVHNSQSTLLSKEHISRIIVDESDVRFATAVDQFENVMRLRRKFDGAEVVERLPSARNLLGKPIDSEQDFAFENAHVDAKDPEMVIVKHKDTGEDVKIKQTFDGALPVDREGRPLPGAKGIDREEFDISKTVVDKFDVHLATLSKKDKSGTLRVRRNFVGARIVDLERKSGDLTQNNGWVGNNLEIKPGRERLANLEEQFCQDLPRPIVSSQNYMKSQNFDIQDFPFLDEIGSSEKNSDEGLESLYLDRRREGTDRRLQRKKVKHKRRNSQFG